MGTSKSNTFLKELIEWVLYIVLAFIIATLINSEVYSLAEVNQTSMLYTLLEKEKLCVDKLSYHFSQPQRGEIVVFLNGETADGFLNRYKNVLEDMKMKLEGEFRPNRLIKRVIGVPGDTLDIKDGKVYLNDIPLEEEYAKTSTTEGTFNLPVLIPEGKLFVMGDNRANSRDSRSFGLIDIKSVEGKAVFRLFPLNRFGKIDK